MHIIAVSTNYPNTVKPSYIRSVYQNQTSLGTKLRDSYLIGNNFAAEVFSRKTILHVKADKATVEQDSTEILYKYNIVVCLGWSIVQAQITINITQLTIL